MIMPESRKSVTVESLLQLKRSERPPSEFWTQFEGELRAKQLAAIVGPRPWYSWVLNVRRLGAVLPVSVGTAAAVGAALLSVHEFRGTAPALAAVPVPALRSAVASVASASVERTQEVALASRTTREAMASRAQGISNGESTVVLRRDSERRMAPAFGPSSVLLTSMPARTAFPDPFSGAMPMTAPATDMPASIAPAAAGTVQWAQVAYVDRTAQTEPLARTVTMADERRAAMLSDPLPNASSAWATASAADPREVSQLSEERLNQAVRRLGVGGDRLLIRF